MPIDYPPEPFARYLSAQYLDVYSNGNYCGATGEVAPGVWRIDVEKDCGGGELVAFYDDSGRLVAVLDWVNWRLNKVEGQ